MIIFIILLILCHTNTFVRVFCLLLLPLLASLFLFGTRRGWARTARAVGPGVILPPLLSHFHFVGVGREGQAISRQMDHFFFAMRTLLFLQKVLLSEAIDFGGHGLARGVQGVSCPAAGAGGGVGFSF